MCYFGPWSDSEGALRRFRAFLKKGKSPTPKRNPPINAVDKPTKPYPAYPLLAHATGRWCKKIRGRFVYFGLQRHFHHRRHAGRNNFTYTTTAGLAISSGGTVNRAAVPTI